MTRRCTLLDTGTGARPKPMQGKPRQWGQRGEFSITLQLTRAPGIEGTSKWRGTAYGAAML
jgi:hypothetical protein